MKILHIIDSGGLYGAEMMLLNLAAEQIKLGLFPTIASIGEKKINDKPLEKEAIRRGINVKKFRMAPGPNLLGAVKLLRYAHMEGFVLLHSHGYKGNILLAFMPKNIRKLPLLATLHGWTSLNGITKMRFYERLDAISLNFIDGVVLVNKGMLKNKRLQKVNAFDFYVVNNGIPFDGTEGTQLPDPIRQKLDPSILDFCSCGFVIGAIGRLSREKGYKYLIQALKILVQEGKDARLVIIGEGKMRIKLEGLSNELGLKERVMMPGYRKAAKNYIPYFNAFSLSSLTEGLPITLLEAMQAKIPIVATNVGGIPEALDYGRAGFIVEPSRPSVLFDAICKIYDDKNFARQMVNKAYRQVTTLYDSKSMALNYLEIYRKFVNKTE
jgi:glycosyltransferase involved in cell wall biosynthesis